MESKVAQEEFMQIWKRSSKAGVSNVEAEVLFKPNTQFIVTKVERVKTTTLVYAEEIINDSLPNVDAPPPAQYNPHESTTDLLNSANEEPPSICNL